MNDMIKIGIIRQNISILLRRAATDKDFRLMCLLDAGKAYFEIAGQTLPTRYIVRFYEQDESVEPNGTIRYVCLPKYYSKTWLG